MIYYRDKKLKKKKRLHALVADIVITKKKTNIDLISPAQRMHILRDVFQMTAIALVSMRKLFLY